MSRTERLGDWMFDDHLVIGFTLFFLGIGVIVLILVIVIMWISFHQSAVSCHNWSVYTHRPSRFVQFNWFDRQCLTPQGKTGLWIPIDQLRGVAGAP